MTEQEWQLRDEEARPRDLKVVSVEIVSWYPSEARAAEFSNLITKELTEYSVAVGFNTNGEAVGATVLGRYIRYEGGKGIMHRAVLKEKANKIFGLTDNPIPHPAE